MDKQRKHLNERVIVYAVIGFLAYAISLFALKTFAIPKPGGIVLTIATMLAIAVFIYKYYRSIFFSDEVHIKIQMEAVVIAFSLSLLLLMTLGMLDLFIELNKDDWSYRHLVPFFVVFYFSGLFISRRQHNFENEKHT